MSSDILSDTEISALLKLAAAAIDNDEMSMEEKADLVDSLDFVAKGLDARRGVEDDKWEESTCAEIKAAYAAELRAESEGLLFAHR